MTALTRVGLIPLELNVYDQSPITKLANLRLLMLAKNSRAEISGNCNVYCLMFLEKQAQYSNEKPKSENYNVNKRQKRAIF